MGLIFKDKVTALIKGYPTVSDKYNVAPAVLDGSASVNFGDLVNYSTTNGYYTAIAASSVTSSTIDKIAGFIVATNVKLNELYPQGQVRVNPGEGFNLLKNGYIAIELASTAVYTDIKPKAKLYVTSSGKVTTISDTSNTVKDSGTAIALPNMEFTGTYELHGSVYYAEVAVCGC